MVGFVYYAPTKVIFGKDTETQIGKLLRELGVKKALVVYGGKSASASGLLERITFSLAAGGVAHTELGGVRPNPFLSLVREGIALYKKKQADFILAVGGGSVIDTAKAIALGVSYGDGDVWDFFAGKAVLPQRCEPVGCILTIAAAGSETSSSCVITNDETKEKRAYANELCRPLFAVMNPELTVTLPPYQTATGCADIFMHTLERYFTDIAPTMELTDSLAEALLRIVMKAGRELGQTPADYNARANLMWAGALSHIDLTELGNGSGDWSCHQIGHELSAKYNIAHGASLTAIWGSWARYVQGEACGRLAQLGAALGLPIRGSMEERALACIDMVEGFFRDIGMPTSFTEAGIRPTQEDIRKIALGVTRGEVRMTGAVKRLATQDIIAICAAAAAK